MTFMFVMSGMFLLSRFISDIFMVNVLGSDTRPQSTSSVGVPLPGLSTGSVAGHQGTGASAVMDSRPGDEGTRQLRDELYGWNV
jgi:hypothetical protein